MPLSLLEFVERWKASTLSERAAAQSHFIDLCEVLGQPHPAAADQSGNSYTFEKHVSNWKRWRKLRKAAPVGSPHGAAWYCPKRECRVMDVAKPQVARNPTERIGSC